MGDLAGGRLKIGKDLHAHIGPVVKAGAFEKLVRNAKSERFDKVKRRVGGGTGPGNVAGVLRNLRLIEKNGQTEALGRMQ